MAALINELWIHVLTLVQNLFIMPLVVVLNERGAIHINYREEMKLRHRKHLLILLIILKNTLVK